MPTVSVIIPTHNRPKLLRQALDSVLQQTHKDLEVIIVDDGSCEQTHLSNAKTLQLDNRVRYAYKKEDRGIAAARNDGIRMASGRYVAFLDDDDVWLPQKLEKQVQFMSLYEHLAVIWCDSCFIDSNGKLLNHVGEMRRLVTSKRELFNLYSGQRPWYWIEREALYRILLCKNVISSGSSTAIVNRQCLVNVGLFDESLPTCEDWDLWIRLALCHNFGYIDEVLTYARAHSQHRVTNDVELMCVGHLRVLDKSYREVPDRFRHHLDAHAYPQYFQFINRYLSQGDFSAAEPIIYRFAQRYGLLAMLHLIVRLVVSSPLTAIQSFVRPANEKGRKAAVRLALRQSIKIAFRYHQFCVA